MWNPGMHEARGSSCEALTDSASASDPGRFKLNSTKRSTSMPFDNWNSARDLCTA